MSPNANVLTVFVSHVPFWEIKKSKKENEGEVNSTTLEQAELKQPVSNNLEMIVSGDLHQLEYLSFMGDRPPQLILGEGGTLLSSPNTDPFKGKCADGDTQCVLNGNLSVSNGKAADVFGFGLMTIAPASKEIAVAVETMDKGTKTWVTLNCTLDDAHLNCPS